MKELEIEITRVTPFGNGVGYDEKGGVYFVPYAIPGDIVRIKVLNDEEKRYCEAELIDIIKPSCNRIEVVCPYFGNCGGCDWLCWDYASELKAKEELIKYALLRSEIVFKKQNPIKPSPQILNYRNRIQIHQLGGKIGFFKRNSHEIVDIDSCYLANSKINGALCAYKKNPLVNKGRIEFLFYGEDVKIIDGNSNESFFHQINPQQNEFLKKYVSSLVDATSAIKVLELYCGDGNLTFSYLNNNIERVIAIDSNSYSISRARKVAKDNVEFINLEVTKNLIKKLPSDFKNSYDTLILDPPRRGVERCLKYFIHPRLEKIIYVSCNILSFIRDVQCLKKRFLFQELQLIDMFPRCRHIEIVGFFSR